MTPPLNLDPFAAIPDDPAARFSLITLAELYAREDPVYRFVADGLLPVGGSSIIVAKPKIGKTTLILNLARSIAAGDDFMGREVKQGLVIYLAFEEKDTEVKLKLMQAHVPVTMPILLHFGAPPTDKLGALRALVIDHHPSLIVIDTLAYWVGVQDFNDYGAVGEALRPIHAIARESDAHIMCVHHAGKGREGGSTIDSPLGSTALTANVDTVLALEEGEGDQRILASRQRYGDHLPRTILNFDRQTFTYSVEGSVVEVKKRDLDEAVLVAVGRRTVLQSALRDQLKCKQDALTYALNRLVAAGHLARTGTGARNSPFMYEATNPPPSVLSFPSAVGDVNGPAQTDDPPYDIGF